jgi:hypothetical protein
LLHVKNDDTSVLSASIDPDSSSLPAAADHLVDWTHYNITVVNEHKSKEMPISFSVTMMLVMYQKSLLMVKVLNVLTI